MNKFDESKVKRDKDGKFAKKNTLAEKKRYGELIDSSFVKADEFRYIKSHKNKKVQGHPAHIYAKNEEQAKYMQMTHSKFIKDMKEANIGLKTNPKPGDLRPSYIVPKSHISDLKDLGKVKDGWKLSELDDKTLLIYRDEPFNK